ncbi:MAG: alanine:cation symporter family protein, partial [Clostridia bacterium]|nr:alanine:cation symporter family protein [Clostridia bacterium]
MKKLMCILFVLVIALSSVAFAEATEAPADAVTEVVETVEETAEAEDAVEATETAEEPEAKENAFLNVVSDVNDAVNNVVWGWPALILLAFVGVLMTLLTKVFQLSHFAHWWKNTIGAIFKDKKVISHTKDKSISQFQSLCTALAATVGTGNIVGVSGAIIIGGPGAVFWMWLIAFFGMMTNYSENVLGIFYRRKNSEGEWSGGAMYYLQDGLGAKTGCKAIGKILAVLFALFCILASCGTAHMTQV